MSKEKSVSTETEFQGGLFPNYFSWEAQNHMAKMIGHMSIRLSDVQAGSSYTVVEIKGGLRVRQNLAKLGVLPGIEVTVEKEAGFRGGLLLDVEGRKVAVARSVATKILVKSSK